MDSNLFITWSGERSKAIALALKDFLPYIINDVKPWVSDGMEKGIRWHSEVANHLENAKLGIICLTPENLVAPWILFEAGALAKTLDDTFVCPYLYNLQPKNIKEPLSQFQVTKAEKEDTKKLMRTINHALGDKLTGEHIGKTFDRFWPDLEDNLKNIQNLQTEPKKIVRSTDDMLEEILDLVRSLTRNEQLDLLHSWDSYKDMFPDNDAYLKALTEEQYLQYVNEKKREMVKRSLNRS